MQDFLLWCCPSVPALVRTLQHSHWWGAFTGCPPSFCHVWLWQFTPVLSHIALTPSVSPLSTSSTGILTFYFLSPLLFSVSTHHCHFSLLKTYTYLNGSEKYYYLPGRCFEGTSNCKQSMLMSCLTGSYSGFCYSQLGGRWDDCLLKSLV